MNEDELRKQLAELGPLRAVTLQLHELYEELKRAGFKRKEALYLVGMMMTAGLVDEGK